MENEDTTVGPDPKGWYPCVFPEEEEGDGEGEEMLVVEETWQRCAREMPQEGVRRKPKRVTLGRRTVLPI